MLTARQTRYAMLRLYAACESNESRYKEGDGEQKRKSSMGAQD